MGKQKPANPNKQQNVTRTPPMEDNQLEVTNLKSLNSLLLHKTVELRAQLSDLQMKIDSMEADQSTEMEVRKMVASDFVKEEIEQDKEKILREKDELRVLLDKSNLEIDVVKGEFARFREEVEKEVDLKESEMERLKSMVHDVQEEARRIRLERDGVLEEKSELESKIEDLKRQMVDVVQEKGEKDGEIKKLEEELEGVNADNVRVRGSIEGVVSERDEIQKTLDSQVREIERLHEQVLDLTKSNSASEEELGKLRGERQKLVNERKDMEGKLEGVNAEIVKVRGNLEGVVYERDEVGKRLDGQVEEVKRLNVQVLELTKCNSISQEELVKLKSERQKLVEEMEDMERKLKGANAEIDMVRGNLKGTVSEFEKRLDDQVKEVERLTKQVLELSKCNLASEEELGMLRSERQKLVEERKDTEGKLEAVKVKIVTVTGDLEGAVTERDETAKRLDSQVEEVKKLNIQVLELTKCNSTLTEELEKLRSERHKLVEESKDMEMKLEGANAEIIRVRSSLEGAVFERDEIQKISDGQLEEMETSKVQITDLRKHNLATEEHLVKLTSERQKLVEEKKDIEGKLELVVKEKGLVEGELAKLSKLIEELKSSHVKDMEGLTLQILDLKKCNLSTEEGLEKLRSEGQKRVEEISVMEGTLQSLVKEKGFVEGELAKSFTSIKELKLNHANLRKEKEEIEQELETKMRSSQMVAEQALLMLKKTVEMVCNHGEEEDLITNTDNIAEEIKAFADELEEIKRAFKSKKGNAEVMNRDFESLKLTVAEAHKKRNFWALLSSAVTVVAAASMAYVARGR